MTTLRPFSIASSGVALAVFATMAHAVPYTITATDSVTDFQSFTVGASVNQYNIAQRGVHWSTVDEWNMSPPALDQSIVSIAGNNAWRMSNATTTSGFSNQPWSPSVAAAGEPGSFLRNDRGADHTSPLNPPNPNGGATVGQFFFEFDFWSSTGAVQPGLALNVSPGPRQSSDRLSFLGLSGDSGGGLGITFFDTNAAGGFVGPVQVATGLDASKVHHVAMQISFVDGVNGDGSGNDVVNIFVNGVLAHTGTTWETFYRLPANGAREVAVDSVMFRASGTAAPATSGNGFVFDNVHISAVPEPASYAMALAGLGLMGFVVRRRRGR